MKTYKVTYNKIEKRTAFISAASHREAQAKVEFLNENGAGNNFPSEFLDSCNHVLITEEWVLSK